MKKDKIIIFTADDCYFTKPIIENIISFLKKDYQIDILIEKRSKKNILKYLLVFFLFSNIYEIIKIFIGKANKRYDSAKIVKKVNKSYKFGISFNYPKKIKKINFQIFNFHLGDFKTQRGIFIFFYKFYYEWKYIELTFHKINKYFDNGLVLKKKRINVKNLSAIQIANLYSKHLNFIYSCLDSLKNKKFKKKTTSKIGIYNSVPTYKKIIKTYL